MYSKYYLEEGKTSKHMVKLIETKSEFDNVLKILKSHHIGGFLISDGHVSVRVGLGKDSLKAKVCKDLGFKYVGDDYWSEAYSKGVKSLGSFM